MGSSSPSIAPANRSAGEGRYDVQGEIGAGGMGVVYRVFDRVAGQVRALKRVAAQRETQSRVIEAFELEYQVLSSLDHPRIIRVFDYGMDAEGPYYTMELLRGRNLRSAAPLPYKTACSYLRDVATSLVLLHGRRLIHRDLSPTNVLATPDGHCKLLDFGALTAFGRCLHVIGTPPMIAPEVIDGSALDQRTDLFALGALAYWMLTGRHAYPARTLDQLEMCWSAAPVPPSEYDVSIPAELDALVLALLRSDRQARPGSAAEVIARVNVIADLPEEDSGETSRLAQSFFVTPRFTGRKAQMRELTQHMAAAVSGKGATLLIDAVPGMGRTRVLEELAIRARLAGAVVVGVDASSAGQLRGVVQALVARLFELIPETARAIAPKYRAPLLQIGHHFGTDIAASPEAIGLSPALTHFFLEVSASRPLMIAVDNLEDADDASQGWLVSLADLVSAYPLLLVVSADSKPASALGRAALRRRAHVIELSELGRFDLIELARSIFSDAPNLERFAEWLHERSAGSPLHAIEICRRLLAKGVIAYRSGLWEVPADPPDADVPLALGDTLSLRINALQDMARGLAECLSLQRGQPTVTLCTLLCEAAEEPQTRARELLDELSHAGVLTIERGSYRFSSSALRTAVRQTMDGERLEQNHRRLGEAFKKLAGDDIELCIEAGFHLIEGADELRGADIIARVTHDSSRFRRLVANLFRAGKPVEAAYKVYRRHRRSRYECLPLLAALAQAGYYEDRYFGETYGDDALTLLEDVTGLGSVRRLQRFMGKTLALLTCMMVALLRFWVTPRAERPYRFSEIMTMLFSTVTTLTGTAALSLDAVRCDAVASVLEPFSFLPERLTPVGIYQFCQGLGQIPRENEVEAYATFEQLLQRFSSPRFYPSLPADGRQLILAGVHFARGSFALFRADGRAALESADALDATGLKLYAMVASQLRYLYYAARGELIKALPHRDQLEVHAAHMGSVWQVETWEAAALLTIFGVAIGDVVQGTHIAHRLDALSRNVPSLKRYSRLAKGALISAHANQRYLHEARQRSIDQAKSERSFIGWAAAQGAVIRNFNTVGDFVTARAIAESVLARIRDEDRELVALFLPVDIHTAYADAGLGHVEAALQRIDSLLARFKNVAHPLLQGMLHEARAYICWNADRIDDYRLSVIEVARWYKPTEAPELIAKYEQLANLSMLKRVTAEVKVPKKGAAQGGDGNDLETVTN